MTRPLWVLALSFAASTAAHAIACDDLKAEIDRKIRAGGIPTFTLTVADAADALPGRVVGTCDNGSRKILYVPAPGATTASRPASPRPLVLTECKPGFAGRDCDRRVGAP